MIDIIIPAYNAHKTIDRCLASVLMQAEPDLRVTIVNDAGENYADAINRYKDALNIREISYSANGGPGTARQYGYDHTDGEFVAFIDADDTFYTPFALRALHMGINMDGGYAACIGQFVEENRGQFLPHPQDLIWMFGKLYRRSFIDKYKIRFCPGSRWNEDNGWNTCMRLCCNEHERINFIPDTVYCWHEQPDSITRAENCRYGYDKSFVGYTENMMWAVEHAHRMAPFNGQADQWAIMSLMNLYEYYIESYARDRRFLGQAWAWCQEYYDRIIRPMEAKLTDDVLNASYGEVMRNAYGRGGMNGIVPHMGVREFLAKLKNREEQERRPDDISDYFPADSQWLKGRGQQGDGYGTKSKAQSAFF